MWFILNFLLISYMICFQMYVDRLHFLATCQFQHLGTFGFSCDSCSAIQLWFLFVNFQSKCYYTYTMPLLQLLKSWRFWIRVLVLLLYVVTITVVLPLLIFQAIKDGLEKFYMIPIIGGLFVIMTLPIAFRLITQHMLYYSKPKLQKHVIR